MKVAIKVLVGFHVMLASLLIAAGNSPVQAAESKDAEQFGEIFVHPRDRHYLPGTAPSRAELFDSGVDYSDERGEVSRWEYRKKNRIITREVWTDENGESRGRVGIGRKF